MDLYEHNAEQIYEAFTLASRIEYFNETEDLFPSAQELVLFWIDKHAAEHQYEYHETDTT